MGASSDLTSVFSGVVAVKLQFHTQMTVCSTMVFFVIGFLLYSALQLASVGSPTAAYMSERVTQDPGTNSMPIFQLF